MTLRITCQGRRVPQSRRRLQEASLVDIPGQRGTLRLHVNDTKDNKYIKHLNSITMKEEAKESAANESMRLAALARENASLHQRLAGKEEALAAFAAYKEARTEELLSACLSHGLIDAAGKERCKNLSDTHFLRDGSLVVSTVSKVSHTAIYRHRRESSPLRSRREAAGGDSRRSFFRSRSGRQCIASLAGAAPRGVAKRNGYGSQRGKRIARLFTNKLQILWQSRIQPFSAVC